MSRFPFQILLCVVLLLPLLGNAQFTDNFDDGDFANTPVWNGDALNFEVLDSVLHLNAPAAADQSYLFTASQSINDATWEFYVQLDFNPSSTNYAKVYLVSNQANLKNPLDGYFVKVGNTADEVSLYKQTDATETEIIDGIDGRVNNDPVNVRIKVTRDAAGNWELSSDTTGGTNYLAEGTVFDITHFSSAFFGVSCVYTSTRSTLFYFDDFVVTGDAFIDTLPPVIDSVLVISATTLDVKFNEPVTISSSQNLANYSVNNSVGNPSSAVRDVADSSIVHLTFMNAFQNGVTNTITISGISDLSGNTLLSASEDFLFFIADTTALYDVIITEIFASPEPQVGLPVAEFVELHNRSAKVFDLSGWHFSDASSSATLGSFVLLPNEYVILCAASDTSSFNVFGNVLGLGSFPSLNNSGDALSLKNASGKLLHFVSYSDTWYRDVLKQDGGWSLEIIATDYPCSGANNWKASNNAAGGTPGKINSVNGANPDESSPSLNYALVSDSLHLILVFDETLNATSAQPQNFSIDNDIVTDSATFVNEAFTEIMLTLGSPLQPNIIYTLTATTVSDCSGNGIGMNDSAQFGLPETSDSFDVVINEILSNPVSGGSDFIELYNRSQKIIDLKDIYIASIDEETGDTNAVLISTSYQLLPGKYFVLTENPQQVIPQYFTPNQKGVLEVAGMPSFDDDEDIVALFNRLDNNSVIDVVHYYDDWHFALIDDLNGVSLERINYNIASQDKSNWHSAASTVGYATPAYQNSQFGGNIGSTSTITLDPKTFSPDNDGYQDVLNIHYTLDQPGYVASITVYDDDGRKTREVVSNWLLDVEGSITWDGINADGEKARIGIYIVIVELFDLSGDVEKFKEVCVVAGKI